MVCNKLCSIDKSLVIKGSGASLLSGITKRKPNDIDITFIKDEFNDTIEKWKKVLKHFFIIKNEIDDHNLKKVKLSYTHNNRKIIFVLELLMGYNINEKFTTIVNGIKVIKKECLIISKVLQSIYFMEARPLELDDEKKENIFLDLEEMFVVSSLNFLKNNFIREFIEFQLDYNFKNWYNNCHNFFHKTILDSESLFMIIRKNEINIDDKTKEFFLKIIDFIKFNFKIKIEFFTYVSNNYSHIKNFFENLKITKKIHSFFIVLNNYFYSKLKNDYIEASISVEDNSLIFNNDTLVLIGIYELINSFSSKKILRLSIEKVKVEICLQNNEYVVNLWSNKNRKINDKYYAVFNKEMRKVLLPYLQSGNNKRILLSTILMFIERNSMNLLGVKGV